MKTILVGTLLVLGLASVASADQASLEYDHVRQAASKLSGKPMNEIRSNTALASKGEHYFVVRMAQAYAQLGYRAFNVEKVFSLTEQVCEDRMYGVFEIREITAGCMTDAILTSRGL